jgi:hypothetical protein
MKPKILFFLLIIFILSSGCQYFKELSYNEWLNTNTKALDLVNVYNGGYYYNATLTSNVPCYWKNGDRVDLPYNPGGNNSENNVNSIFIDGKDVYCAGNIYNGTVIHQNACYWKNGIRHNVKIDNPTTQDSNITSIAVGGGIVYCAGYEGLNACFWMNDDVKNTLNQQAPVSGATSIYIDINYKLDFYISGYYGTALTLTNACYWKNGTDIISLTNSFDGSRANSIFVSGGKVYAAGLYSLGACYWEDGILNTLAGGTQAFTVYVYNGDVYTAGNVGAASAAYWKNGMQIWVEPTSSGANSIYIFDNDVYVTGYINSQACYWKNSGSPISLPVPSIASFSFGTSGVVKQQQ